jgi:hypothetical protein
MASITHLGVGLAAKRLAPKVPVVVLILAAYAIDFIWAGFYFAGIEHLPGQLPVTTNPWSHGLFMASVWSLLLGLAAFLVSRRKTLGLGLGLLVFSHWLIDWISHPMTAIFPGDTGLSLLFDGSPTVGLGWWRTPLAANLGEYLPLGLGIILYALTLRQLRREKKTTSSV